VQIIRFPDPFQEARDYLAEQTGHPVGYALPDAYTATSGPFIRITDTGGPGARDVVLEDVRLTVDVWANPRGKASEIARTAYGVLQMWPYQEPGVFWRGTVSRPAFYPDETRIPRYVMTVNLAFRGAPVEVTP
jgi:hypothetical protein